MPRKSKRERRQEREQKARLTRALKLHQEGKLDEALPIYELYLRHDPRNSEILNAIGSIHKHYKRYPQAIDCYTKAIEYANPSSPIYNFNLGNLLSDIGKNEEALMAYRQAMDESEPGVLQDKIQFHLASNLANTGYHDESFGHFQALMAKFPDDASVLNNFANCLQAMMKVEEAIPYQERVVEMAPTPAYISSLGHSYIYTGQLDKAREHFRRALSLDPRYCASYFGLLKIGSDLTPSEEVDVRELAADMSLTDMDRSLVSFGLAQYFDKRGKYDLAFQYVSEANRLFGQEYDIDGHERELNAMIEYYTPEVLPTLPSSGSLDDRPVFIVGMPRSGTSLVEQIISSHPQAFGAGELLAINDIAKGLGAVDTHTADHLKQSTEYYFRRLYRDVDDSILKVSDKMPQNFLHLALIYTLLPKATIVHCKRNPLDICLSCYMQPFKSVNFSYSFEVLGRWYLSYERLMEHWKRVLPLKVVEVQYETLVANLESEARRLVTSLGLGWDDRCAKPHLNKRAVYTASDYQVREPVYGRSVGRWRNYEKHLGPLFEALGDTGDRARMG